jgi:hypothetical protein
MTEGQFAMADSQSSGALTSPKDPKTRNAPYCQSRLADEEPDDSWERPLPSLPKFEEQREQLSGRSLFGGLGARGGLFAFDVSEAALAFDAFVILLSHNALLLSRLY